MADAEKKLSELLGRWKYVLLVAAVGLALMLWPSADTPSSAAGEDTEEARLEQLLSSMEGVGCSEVLLSESGAVVVCQGADNATVRLHITDTIRCYTGLGTDKIAIFKMNESWRDEP